MKIISDGVELVIPTGGTDFTVDPTLTMSSSNVLGVTIPVKGVVTQEEFDALPTTEKDQGVYFIPGPGTAEIENIYSLEEMVVGRWIDGKPLYRKTMQFKTPSVTNTATAVAYNLDWDFLLVVNGFLYRTSTSRYTVAVTNFSYEFSGTGPGTLFMSLSDANATGMDCTATFLYTKFSDTGGVL